MEILWTGWTTREKSSCVPSGCGLAMRLLGFEGFWVGHFHLRWDAAAMEEALQELLDKLGLGRRLHRAIAMGDKSCTRPSSVFITFVRVKEYVFFPDRGEDSPHPKLYELVHVQAVDHVVLL